MTFHLFKWLQRRVTSKPHEPAPVDNWASLLAKICPACKHHPVVLYEGPSGGMSTNVFCGNCGQGYNMTPMLNSAEEIGVDMRYCTNEQAKARHALKERFNA